jgi:hypothetical protein
LGFRLKGLGFGILGLGLRGYGCELYEIRFWLKGLGLGFRVQGDLGGEEVFVQLDLQRAQLAAHNLHHLGVRRIRVKGLGFRV